MSAVQPPPEAAGRGVRTFVEGVLALDGRMLSLIALDEILPEALAA